MTAKHKFAVAIGVIFLIITATLAENLATVSFDLSWNTIDSGGGSSAGGTITLTGTIGQHDASDVAMTGGDFSLTGGFWAGEAIPVPICPADVSPTGGDGMVNVSDLLTIINAWGSCIGCPADVNHDNAVNVADLLAVINAWGVCP